MPPQHPPSKPLARLPPPLPMPTHGTQSGPEQSFGSFVTSTGSLRSMRSTRSSSSAVAGGSSSARAGGSGEASSTGPYLGLGIDAQPVASGSKKRKAADPKGKGKAKVEDDGDNEEDKKPVVGASSSSSAAKTKGKGKERARPTSLEDTAEEMAVSSRRRVIPPPKPGEESDEEPNESGMERLSDYQCPVCLCPPVQATLTPCGHLMCHLCLTTSLASTAVRTFVPPPVPPRWRPIGSASLPLKHAPASLNIEGQCPVCREVLPGGLNGKGRRTGTAAARGGRRGRGGFGMGGRYKETDGKGEGVRRIEMRIVDC